MVELSLKDQILDSQDDIDTYLKELIKMRDAFHTIGNETFASKLHAVVVCIQKETKKTKALADKIGVE